MSNVAKHGGPILERPRVACFRASSVLNGDNLAIHNIGKGATCWISRSNVTGHPSATVKVHNGGEGSIGWLVAPNGNCSVPCLNSFIHYTMDSLTFSGKYH